MKRRSALLLAALPGLALGRDSALPVPAALPGSAALSAKWKIRVTPTVLFFDVRGTGIAARLEGISTDFYGAYLYGALDAARQRLKNN